MRFNVICLKAYLVNAVLDCAMCVVLSTGLVLQREYYLDIAKETRLCMCLLFVILFNESLCRMRIMREMVTTTLGQTLV